MRVKLNAVQKPGTSEPVFQLHCDLCQHTIDALLDDDNQREHYERQGWVTSRLCGQFDQKALLLAVGPEYPERKGPLSFFRHSSLTTCPDCTTRLRAAIMPGTPAVPVGPGLFDRQEVEDA